MPRVSEFEWRAPRKPRRKPWTSLVLIGAGLATGYFFVLSGRQAANVKSPPVGLQERMALSGATESAHNEMSAIASAPVRLEVINARPQENPAQPNLPAPSLRTEDDRMGAAPSYTTRGPIAGNTYSAACSWVSSRSPSVGGTMAYQSNLRTRFCWSASLSSGRGYPGPGAPVSSAMASEVMGGKPS